MEITNEVLNMLVSYHYFLFTDFVPDPELRYNFGWSSIYCTLALIAINMIILIKDSSRIIFLYLKRWVYRRKYRKMLK
jgi:hypothetical protein